MWSLVPDWTENLLLAFQFVHITSGVFFYLGSAANPVLYSLMSSRFRENFRQALGLGTQCRRRRRQHRRSSHNLSKLTTGSTYDFGSRNSRAGPLAENGNQGFHQETELS